MNDVDNEGGYACVREGSMCKISVSSSQFYCKPKTAVKGKVLKIKKMRTVKKQKTKSFKWLEMLTVSFKAT